MGVSYDGSGSPLIEESTHDIWTAGRRCPDVYLLPSGQQEPKRLYEVLAGQYGKHVVLKIGGDGKSPASADSLNGVARLFKVAPHSAEGRTTGDADVVEFSAEWAKEDDEFVVVVRPDMYIGYVGQGEGWKQYLAYLTQ